MLKRYQELSDFISKLDEVEIDELMPRQADNRRIESDTNELLKLLSVTWRTKENNGGMTNVRGLFDSVVDEFLVTSSRLSTMASTTHNPTFESSVVKI